MTQRIIYVCGADMTGKTQIAKEIARRYDIPYFKSSGEHRTFIDDPDRFINDTRYADPRQLDFLKQTGYDVVFDRGYPCEYVYSHVLGRQMDTQMLRYLDDEYARLGALIIICYRSSFQGIEDDLDPKRLNSDTLQYISDTYMKFAKTSACRTYLLNVDDEDLEREMIELEGIIR